MGPHALFLMQSAIPLLHRSSFLNVRQSSFVVQRQLFSPGTVSPYHVDYRIIDINAAAHHTPLHTRSCQVRNLPLPSSHCHPCSIFNLYPYRPANINGFPPQHRQAKDLFTHNREDHHFLHGSLPPRDLQALRQRSDRVHKDTTSDWE